MLLSNPKNDSTENYQNRLIIMLLGLGEFSLDASVRTTRVTIEDNVLMAVGTLTPFHRCVVGRS